MINVYLLLSFFMQTYSSSSSAVTTNISLWAFCVYSIFLLWNKLPKGFFVFSERIDRQIALGKGVINNVE